MKNTLQCLKLVESLDKLLLFGQVDCLKVFDLVLFQMGFGTDFQGRESHDALVHIQDTEIRLLENMKSCLQKRIDGDRKYIASLNSFVQLGLKLDKSEYDEYCSVFKVSLCTIHCSYGCTKILRN